MPNISFPIYIKYNKKISKMDLHSRDPYFDYERVYEIVFPMLNELNRIIKKSGGICSSAKTVKIDNLNYTNIVRKYCSELRHHFVVIDNSPEQKKFKASEISIKLVPFTSNKNNTENEPIETSIVNLKASGGGMRKDFITRDHISLSDDGESFFFSDEEDTEINRPNNYMITDHYGKPGFSYSNRVNYQQSYR